jgi:hypothetical protein
VFSLELNGLKKLASKIEKNIQKLLNKILAMVFQSTFTTSVHLFHHYHNLSLGGERVKTRRTLFKIIKNDDLFLKCESAEP